MAVKGDLEFASNIKRERQKRECIRKEVQQMRKKLPVYTIEEIREYKMPYDEALLINLEQNGFISTATFIKELIEFQTQARIQAGVGSNVWLRPLLKNCKEELKILSDGLRESETFNKEADHYKECKRFLKLAIYFAFLNSDWWWLGEQLILQSIRIAIEYSFADAEFEALSRFAYAKFLIENVKEYDSALHHLLIARELCSEKAFSLRYYFPEFKNPVLFMQINYYTYLCHMREAKTLMRVDFERAAEIAMLAKKRATEACYYEGEIEALLLKGQCALNLLDSKSAVLQFHKALRLQEKQKSTEGMCKVMIQLAKAYLMDGNTNKAFKVLVDLKETAEKHHLFYYLSQAYKNLGEFYLNNGEPKRARELLLKSIKIFEEHVSEHVHAADIEKIRILEAIASGLDLFSEYLSVLNNPSNENFPGILNITKLVNWKDTREFFWRTTAADLTESSFYENKNIHYPESSTVVLHAAKHKKPPDEIITSKDDVVKRVMSTAIGRFAQRMGVDNVLIIHDDLEYLEKGENVEELANKHE